MCHVTHEQACAVDPAREIHRRDQRLDRVGEDVRLLPLGRGPCPAPHRQALPQACLPPPSRQGRSVDQGGAHAGELTLASQRMFLEERLGHADPEHGIAQELEPLVVFGQRLVGEARVRERLPEPGHIPLADQLAQLPFEARAGERDLLGHVRFLGISRGPAQPASSSVASARARSKRVSPATSCVIQATLTVLQRMSISGW